MLEDPRKAQPSDLIHQPHAEYEYGPDHELRRGSWRHTTAHEHVFMLVKGMQYWSNAEAVRERSAGIVERPNPLGKGQHLSDNLGLEDGAVLTPGICVGLAAALSYFTKGDHQLSLASFDAKIGQELGTYVSSLTGRHAPSVLHLTSVLARLSEAMPSPEEFVNELNGLGLGLRYLHLSHEGRIEPLPESNSRLIYTDANAPVGINDTGDIGEGNFSVHAPDDTTETAPTTGRNPRSVLHVPTAPYRGAHYATFPPALIAPLILATCPRWCCPVCGQGWAPVVEQVDQRHWTERRSPRNKWREGADHGRNDFGGSFERAENVLGYRPTCSHPHTQAEAVPGIVFDPFVGSGTTVMVARQLLRRGIGFDLSRPYLDEQAKVRTGSGMPSTGLDNLPLFRDTE